MSTHPRPARPSGGSFWMAPMILAVFIPLLIVGALHLSGCGASPTAATPPGTTDGAAPSVTTKAALDEESIKHLLSKGQQAPSQLAIEVIALFVNLNPTWGDEKKASALDRALELKCTTIQCSITRKGIP